MINKFIILFGPLFLTKFHCKPRHGIKKILGIYERKITRVLRKIINKGDICLDIGSHIGYTSLLMSKFVGKKGTIYAIDPSEENFDFISRTINDNQINNIIPFLGAIGEKSEIKKAYFYEDSQMYNIIDSGFLPNDKYHSVHSIQTIQLEDFIKSKEISRINFIKIDIEGFELSLLRSISNLFFQKFNPIFLIEIHNPSDSKDIFHYFEKIGYKMFDINLSQIPENKLSSISGIYHAIFKKN